MQKIINSHCHIYPEKIADKAVLGIRNFYDLDMSLNGKLDDLLRDGNEVGVHIPICLPVLEPFIQTVMTSREILTI